MSLANATPDVEVSPRRWPAVLAIAIYVAIAIGIAWLEYNFSVYGFSFVAGEASAALLIPGIVAAFVARRGNPSSAFCVAIAVSAGVLVYSHLERIRSAIDVREFKAEVATATPQNYVEVLKRAHSRLGKTFSAMLSVEQQEGAQLSELLRGLDDPRFKDALSADTLRDRAKMILLTDLAERKRQLAAGAGEKIDAIYVDMDARITHAGQELLPSERAEMLDGYKESRPKVVALLKEYAQAYEDLYDNLVGIYSILAQQSGHYEVRGPGSVVLYDRTAVSNFNRDLKSVLAAAGRMRGMQHRLAEAATEKIEKIIHTADQ